MCETEIADHINAIGVKFQEQYGEKYEITPELVWMIYEGKDVTNDKFIMPDFLFLQSFMDGELDCDKMDYLLRDSHYCGVTYGQYDLNRFVSTLTVHKKENRLRLAIERGGIPREEFVETYTRHHQALNPQLLAKPMADVEKVLAKICETGRKNYIFTHRKCSTTAQYLEKYGLDRYFTEIVGPEAPNFAYKPSPDSLLYLMDKYGMTAGDAVMVGDRDCDLGSARNAGICTAHFVCAMVPEQLSCNFRFESYKKMLAIL
jgi:phosphoglycolate phosphatase-like HAD superfamily hydrolase